MGKAKILSGGENGLYTIQLDYGDEERDKVVEKLAGRLKELAPQLDEAKAKLDEAKGKENASKDATKEATDDYVAATKVVPVAFKAVTTATNDLPGKAAALQRAIGWLKSVTAMEPPASPEQLALAEAAVAAADAAHKSAQGALKTAEAEYAAAQADVKAKMDAQVAAAKELVAAKKETAPLEIAHELLKDERSQLIKDRSYYAGLHLVETRKAWCADLTEDAKDEVATIEIPGDSNLVLINAGAEDGGTVDGVLFAREMQSPEQVFWNAAVLPGWQKWKPTYRRGTITALDLEANTADVALEEETSTGQNLNINQTKTLEKVPVNYMGCNAEAFEVGDACVVRFDDMNWETPRVMGFVDNPKSCPGGIGISTDTDMAIYRPGAGGEWTKRVATALNGGVAYVAKGGMVLVESGAGLFRGNKRVAGALHGASEAPYIGGGQSFPVSGLFISHGAVQQLKASGDSLLLAGRALRQLGNTSSIMQAATYALPPAPQGERWGMASAAQDGSKFAVCRIKTEEGTSDYVTAVAHFAEDTSGEDEADAPEQQGAMLVLESVQETERRLDRREPDSDDAQAPEWGEFAYAYTTVDGDADDRTDRSYRQDLHFASEATRRAYIGHLGDMVIDTETAIHDATMNYKYHRYNLGADGYNNLFTTRDSATDVSIHLKRRNEIKFGEKLAVTVLSTDVDYQFIDYHRGARPPASPRYHRGYSATCKAEQASERVILADEQFSVVVSIKAAMGFEWASSLERGPFSATGDDVIDYNMGYLGIGGLFPQIKTPQYLVDYFEAEKLPTSTATLDPLRISLEVLTSSGSTSITLDAPVIDQEAVKRGMTNIAKVMENDSFGTLHLVKSGDLSGESASGFFKYDGVPIESRLMAHTVERVADQLSDIMYAKDPKTGVGFLSFRWGDETKNYVVGPWGVEPSSSRTEVASDAKVSSVVSV